MSTSSEKLARWKLLDHLLAQCEPISQNEIMEEYQNNATLRLIDKAKYNSMPDTEKKQKLSDFYLDSLRKDLSIFRATLNKLGLTNMLIVSRGAEDKLYDEGKDNRTKLFRYRNPNFSIIPYLTDEMSDSEYRRLVSTINKLKGVLSEQTFEEIRFSVLSRVEADYGKGIQCVEYEDNRKLKGRQFRPIIYKAIIEKQVLRIKYKTFGGYEFEYDFHPYLLKQYNERWFAFGLLPLDGNRYFNIPLDRLTATPEPIGRYNEQVPNDYARHFDKIIGVTRLSGRNLEHIVIKIHDIDSWGRATTKPLVSQKTECEFNPESGFGLISLDVFPNNELYSKLLSWGKNVEIVSPQHIRTEMKEILESLVRYYAPKDISGNLYGRDYPENYPENYPDSASNSKK